MLKDFGDIAVKLSRNPLGVISLAFVLVYLIAGLVSTSSKFQAGERLMLVWFMVLFPVVILIAFCWLVSCHHKKLFGPQDFTQDENFLAFTSGEITQEEALQQGQASQARTPMEYKILNTLWTKQVNLDPCFLKIWTFRFNYGAPEFIEMRIASSKLMGEGLLGETNDGQVHLTSDGYSYCKKSYTEFPSDQWWPENEINPENLKQALANQ